MRWMKSTARSRMTEHRNKIAKSKKCPQLAIRHRQAIREFHRRAQQRSKALCLGQVSPMKSWRALPVLPNTLSTSTSPATYFANLWDGRLVITERAR
jgi:hypothetical protein